MSSFRFPTMHSAGFFDSRETFGDMVETKKRPVFRCELEFFSTPGGVLFIDDRRYEITADMVFVARPGSVRHSILPFCAHFVKVEHPEGEIGYMLARLSECRTTLQMPRYLELVRDIAANYSSDKCSKRLYAHARFFELLSMLYEEQKQISDVPASSSGRHRQAVSDAIAYMNTHYRERCTLEEIAAAVNFSPIYFNRLFLSMTGETPYAYMSRRRMEDARMLLATTDELIFEISERCGFSSPSYFTAAFRHAYGMTPRVFRETERKKYWDD